jgi:hypothetical protein
MQFFAIDGTLQVPRPVDSSSRLEFELLLIDLIEVRVQPTKDDHSSGPPHHPSGGRPELTSFAADLGGWRGNPSTGTRASQ